MNYSNDTQWISAFTLAVTSSSNKVFSNGRHQVEITVGVTPQEGEEVTEAQMASIQLVTLDEDGNYQALSGDLQLGTERDERFDYHPDAGSASDTTGLESTTLHRTFYVSSTRSEDVQDTLYAVISKDDETGYVTHGEPGASVIVESIVPTPLSHDDFIFWGNNAPDREHATSQADCEIYSLAFKDAELRIVASLPRGAGEGVAYYLNHLDISPWDDADDEDEYIPTRFQNFHHYAYKVGEHKEFVFQGTTIPLNQTPGVMNFVRLKTTSESPEVAFHHEASRWALLDQYGNAHTIEMKQLNDGAGMHFALLEYI